MRIIALLQRTARRLAALGLAGVLLLTALPLTALPAMAEADAGDAGIYAAYADVLQRHRKGIRFYWQGGGSWDTGDYLPTVEPRAIVLADIMGDDTPELVFIAKDESDGEMCPEADLFVYGWQDGEAREILMRPCVSTYIPDVGVLCLYQTEGDRDLYAAVFGPEIGYYHWFSEDGVTLREESLLETYDDGPVCLANGQYISPDQYAQLMALFPDSADKLLVYSVCDDLDGRDLIGAAGRESLAMTYDEAVDFLRESGASDVAPTPAPAASDGEKPVHEAPEVLYPEYDPAYADLYRCYAEVLMTNEEYIRDSNIAGGRSHWVNPDEPHPEPRGVALVDVMGDEAPELIIAAPNPVIYSCRDGQAVEHPMYFFDPTSAPPGSEARAYCLYQVAGSRDLHCVVSGDHRSYRHTYSEDGETMINEELIEQILPAPTRMEYYIYIHWDEEWMEDDFEEITQERFEQIYETIPRNPEAVVLYSYVAKSLTNELVLDGRDAVNARDLPCMGLTWDEALDFLLGADRAAFEAERAGSAPDAQADIPDEQAAADLQMTRTLYGDEISLIFYMNGRGDFSYLRVSDELFETYNGTVDRVEPVSDHVYAMHIASIALDESSMYVWGEPFDEGETLLLVDTGADEGELEGEILPTDAQRDAGQPAAFDPAYYYIGRQGDGGVQFQPYRPN